MSVTEETPATAGGDADKDRNKGRIEEIQGS